MDEGSLTKLQSVDSSPRSTLAWKDYWVYEGASLESSPRSNPLLGASAADPGSPTTPPLQSERVSCQSTSTEQNWPTTTLIEGPVAAVDEWHSLPPTTTFGAYQSGSHDEGRDSARISEHLERTWRQDRSHIQSTPCSLSRAGSIGCTSEHEDEIFVDKPGEGSWTARSSTSEPVPVQGVSTVLHNRVHFIDSMSEELANLTSCAKRALDLGKKAQRFAAAEVSELRGEKAKAEATAQKFVELSRELEQQVVALRDEKQKLETERDELLMAVRDEKKKREALQMEKDSVMSSILDERMKLDADRQANDNALRNEKTKLEAMEKERDAAVKALFDGLHKLDLERATMLEEMRNLTAKLDQERDAKLRSMRRSSMDICVANMNSSERKLSRRKSMLAFK